MSDARLRELERRWSETGAVNDEAVFLLERVRAGDLTQEQLELAAYCGHEAARLGLGEQAPEIPSSLEDWLHGLGKRDMDRAFEAALLATRTALAKHPIEAQRPEVREALRSAERWCRDRTPPSATVSRDVSRMARQRPMLTPAVMAVRGACQLVDATTLDDPNQHLDQLVEVFREASRAIASQADFRTAKAKTVESESADELFATLHSLAFPALRDEVVPTLWVALLGTEDKTRA